MELGKASRVLRATLITGIGMVVTFALAMVIGFFAMKPDASSSLAERVDVQRTQMFLRTANPMDITTLAAWWGKTLSPDLMIAGHHALEFAIQTESGGLEWSMETRPGWGESDARIHSSKETKITKEPLPQNQKGSLALDSFFRLHAPSVNESGVTLLSVKCAGLPSVITDNKPILRSIIRPFSDALLTWTASGANRDESNGTLWLKPRHPLRYTTSAFMDERDFPKEASGTVLAIVIGHPSELLSTLVQNLGEEDPGFAEGFEGIARAFLRRLTGQTDIRSAWSDLLEGPAFLSVKERGESGYSVLFSGIARNQAILEQWTKAMTAASSPAMIRSIPLERGDRRTDVSLQDQPAAVETSNGWMIRSIDSTLSIATRGNAYVVSNDRPWMDDFLSQKSRLVSLGMNAAAINGDAGELNLGALRTLLNEFVPLLSELLNNPLLPADREGTLTWSARNTPGSVELRWAIGH